MLATILQGPPHEKAQMLADWAAQQHGEDPADCIQRHSAHWIRDRLWMVREYLDGIPKQTLTDLVDRYGVAEHPTFTSFMSAYWAPDVTPTRQAKLARLSPEQLMDYVRQWKPDEGSELGPEHVSYAGLAGAVAEVVISAPDRYAAHLGAMASHRAEFALAVVSRLPALGAISAEQWQVWIGLFERLLTDDHIRTDVTYGYEAGWASVRVAIARAIEAGLTRQSHAVPAALLPRLKSILFTLIDDPDPLPQHDRPPEGSFGHDDPLTVALNHVRPIALTGLVHYARVVARTQHAGEEARPGTPGTAGRLEADVREALGRKLDTAHDPSRAVHSVYGHFLLLLHSLDPDWVSRSIDRIFPEEDDDESVWFFVAAWDAFVSVNLFSPHLLDLLRPKYERAIRNLAGGYVTRSLTGPHAHLATHLVWQYLLSDVEPDLPGAQHALIARYFETASPEVRASGAWACWRVCHSQQFDREAHWHRLRSLLEWRTRESSLANHSPDFDAEMRWFANLLPLAPGSETIQSLWPVLERLLPHVSRPGHQRSGWEAVVTYLSREVDRDPVRAIQLYRLMCDLWVDPQPRPYHYPAERRIVEVAASNGASRTEALALIDSLARRGDYTFRDIYDRYA